MRKNLREKLKPYEWSGYEVERKVVDRALRSGRKAPSLDFGKDLVAAIRMTLRYDRFDEAADLLQEFAGLPYKYRTYTQSILVNMLYETVRSPKIALKVLPHLLETTVSEKGDRNDIFTLKSLYALGLFRAGRKSIAIKLLRSALFDIYIEPLGAFAAAMLVLEAASDSRLPRCEARLAIDLWGHFAADRTLLGGMPDTADALEGALTPLIAKLREDV